MTKKAFAHYMACNRTRGGSVAGYAQDIRDAQGMGVDGFAWNLGSWQTADYKQDTESVFLAAELVTAAQIASASPSASFLLYFSMDMTGDLSDADMIDMVTRYSPRPNYYKKAVPNSAGGTDLRPMVNTWGGEDSGGAANYPDTKNRWLTGFINPLKAAGINIFFVPRFFVHWAAPDVAALLAGLADGAFVPTSLGYIPPNPGQQDVVADAAWQLWNVKSAGLYTQVSVSPQYYNVKPINDHAYYEYHGGLGLRTQFLAWIANPNVDDIILFTWQDLDEATYFSPVFDVVDIWDYFYMHTRGFYHQRLTTYEDAKWYIQAFKSGAEPAVTQDVMSYQYRLTPDAVDHAFIKTRLTAPASVNFTSGDGVLRTVNVPAGWAHTPLPLVPGPQQFSLLRNGVVLATQTGAPVLPPPYAQYNNIYFEGLMTMPSTNVPPGSVPPASASVPPASASVPPASASVPPASAPVLLADYDLAVGPAVTEIGEAGATLVAGSDGYVHAQISLVHSEDGMALDLSGFSAVACLVPQGRDYDPAKDVLLPASWLVRTVPPAGEYVRLPVGPEGSVTPPVGFIGRLYAEVTITGEVLRIYSSGNVSFH